MKKLLLLTCAVIAVISMTSRSVYADDSNKLSFDQYAREGEKVNIKVRSEKNKYNRVEFGDGSYTYVKSDDDGQARTWHQYACKHNDLSSTYTVRVVEQSGNHDEKKIVISCNSQKKDGEDRKDGNNKAPTPYKCDTNNARIISSTNNTTGGNRIDFTVTNFRAFEWVTVNFGDGQKVDVKTDDKGKAGTWHVFACKSDTNTYLVSAQSNSCSTTKSTDIVINTCYKAEPTKQPSMVYNAIPTCPAYTTPLFDYSMGSSINKGSKTKFGGIVTDSSRTWNLQTINSNILLKADDQHTNNVDLAIKFPGYVNLDSVLIYDNDPKTGEHYWRVNNIELNHRAPGNQNNKWAPLHSLKQDVNTITLDTGGDSAHINFCIKNGNYSTPTPTQVVTSTPTRTPSPTRTPTPTQPQTNPWIELLPNPSTCTQLKTEKVIVKLHAFNINQYVHVEFGDGSYVDTYVDGNGNGQTDHTYATLNTDNSYTVRVVNMTTGMVITKSVLVKACAQATPTPTKPPVEPCKDLSVNVKVTLEGQTIERSYATGVGPYYPIHDAGTASVDQLFEFTANFAPVLSRYWQGQYIDVKPNYWDMKNGTSWMPHFFLKGFHSVDENQMRSVASHPVNADMVTQIAYIPGQETFVTKDVAGNMCGVIFEQDLDPPVAAATTMSASTLRTVAQPKKAVKIFN